MMSMNFELHWEVRTQQRTNWIKICHSLLLIFVVLIFVLLSGYCAYLFFLPNETMTTDSSTVESTTSEGTTTTSPFNKYTTLVWKKIDSYINSLKASVKSATTNLSNLTNEDLKVIAAYIKIMEPVALDRLQGEKNCGQGFILPTLTTMVHNIKQHDGSPLLKHFQETMVHVVKKRFQKHLKVDELNKDVVLGAISILRLKTKFIKDYFDWSVSCNMLVSECINLSTQLRKKVDVEPNRNTLSDDDYFVAQWNKTSKLMLIDI